MTGNFYCIPDRCAKVVYREYLPPVVRWRYEGEDWQEIENADDYQLQQDWYGGQNPNIQYRYKYGRASANSGGFLGWAISYADQPAQVVLPIQKVRLIIGSTDYGVYEHWAFRRVGSGNPPPDGSRNRRYLVQVFDATRQWKLWLNTISTGHKVFGFEPADGSSEENPGGGNCIFTVFFDGVIVHEETRAECPEVEKLDCRLSDEYKEITLEKLPFLERVEVRNQDISTFFLPPLDTPFTEVNSLPEHSLNIYRTIQGKRILF